jgi:hypothetical protein
MIIVVATASAYTALMLASFVAALACVIATPQPRAGDVTNAALVDGGAMSQAVEVGPLSTPETADTVAQSAPEMPDMRTQTAPMTPLEIDCETAVTDEANTPSDIANIANIDWSALACRFDDGGSYCVIHYGHSRTATLRAVRGRGARRVFADAVSAAPELLLPDFHGAPLLWPPRLAFSPTFTGAPLAQRAPQMPPAAPTSRIDRPPRA